MNYSDIQTEKELKELTTRIQDVYKVAWAEARQEASAYFRHFEARYKKEYKAFEQGKYTEQEFKNWYWAQVGRGEKWEKVRDNMRDTFTQANVTAAGYIKDATPGVYALNANYEAYTIYKETGVDFAAYDERTVANLLHGKTKILPSSRVSIPKSDAWNTKQLENSLLSGILQGKDIYSIADAFQNVASMDRNAAVRNARTAMTAAQNAGRQDTYERAHEMGINMRKEWMATVDERTRESHAELDGVQVEYDEDFPNGLKYPGDPSGDPAEIYNCRCTVRAIIPKYNGQARESQIEGHEGIHTKETYEEWRDARLAAQAPTSFTDATGRALEAKEDAQGQAVGIQQDNQPQYAKDIKDYLGQSSTLNQQELGEKILGSFGCNVPVSTYTRSKSFGYVTSQNRNGVMKNLNYNLKSNDYRSDGYKVKTAFHESYHALSDGKLTDMPARGKWWTDIEEVFAETSAHYNAALVGFSDLGYSYAERILSVVPSLVQTSEFSGVKTLQEIGEIAYNKRVNGGGSVWTALANECKAIKADKYDFCRKYTGEVKNNIESYVDKILEMYPASDAKNRDIFIKMLDSGIDKIEKGEARNLTKGEIILTDTAIVSAVERTGL